MYYCCGPSNPTYVDGMHAVGRVQANLALQLWHPTRMGLDSTQASLMFISCKATDGPTLLMRDFDLEKFQGSSANARGLGMH